MRHWVGFYFDVLINPKSYSYLLRFHFDLVNFALGWWTFQCLLKFQDFIVAHNPFSGLEIQGFPPYPGAFKLELKDINNNPLDLNHPFYQYPFPIVAML